MSVKGLAITAAGVVFSAGETMDMEPTIFAEFFLQRHHDS